MAAFRFDDTLIICPTCQIELRITVPSSKGGPCPSCGTQINLIPRNRKKAASCQTAKTLPVKIDLPRRAPRPAQGMRWKSFRGQWREFSASKEGRAVLAGLFLITFVGAVIGFFEWDEQRRAREMESSREPRNPGPGGGEEEFIVPASWERDGH